MQEGDERAPPQQESVRFIWEIWQALQENFERLKKLMHDAELHIADDEKGTRAKIILAILKEIRAHIQIVMTLMGKLPEIRHVETFIRTVRDEIAAADRATAERISQRLRSHPVLGRIIWEKPNNDE